ncbi:phosphodiester glycosidase family protein [Acidovorax sp. NCPPB 2350]|nr:phosphodiester glycosidase family protein [Acidovorax sp. NCPPB 2350]
MADLCGFLVAIACGLTLCLPPALHAAPLAAQPPVPAAISPAAEPAVIGVVAPGDCWRQVVSDAGLAQHLARCAALGVDLLRLQLREGADGTVSACATEAACTPLPAVLAASPAPSLLLETPVALLDAVQREVGLAGAAARVRVAPQFARPVASPLPHLLAPGVRYWVERRDQPRPMMVHVVEIDFQQTGQLEFVTTPAQPAPADAVAVPGSSYFTVQKTSAFARQAGLLAAVNASYFLPFNGGRLMFRPYVPQPGSLAAVAQARLHDALQPGEARGDPRADGMVCLRPGGFSLHSSACPPGWQPAFAAGPVLIEAGRRRPLQARDAEQQPDATGLPRYYREPEPRTALGLDGTGRRAWMVVVDGRQSGYSEGMTLPELAELFAALGARDAINLDGGGSSTLALSGEVANSPIHTSIPGRERPVANHFGLRLMPLPGLTSNESRTTPGLP